MKILFSADWHLDQTNLDVVEPALKFLSENVPRGTDLFIHGGDVAVHRGSINPHISFLLRKYVKLISSQCETGSLIVQGNHDQSFHRERSGSLDGIFSDLDLPGGRLNRIHTEIGIDHVKADFGKMNIGIVTVPTPDKYWVKTIQENQEDRENPLNIATLLWGAIQGKIAEARQTSDHVIVVYHGTVSGGQLGNEMVMTSGIDVVVPREAFQGADLVLAGHLHHKQKLKATSGSPAILYPGSVAPLTWNDVRLDPCAYEIEITSEGITWREIEIPVFSQLLHLDIEIDPESEPMIKDRVSESLLGIGADVGDRIRVKVRASKAALLTLDEGWKESIKEVNRFESFTIIPDRTDSAMVRLSMDDGWTVPAAFDRWMDFQNIPDKEQEDLRAFAMEIESEIEDQHLDAKYDFKPINLRLRNWCQYESVDLDFTSLGQVTAITGENYTGKSNLTRSIIFALFKKQMTGDKIGDLIRKGEKKAEVTLDFESHHQRYRIRRDLKSTPSGASSELILWRIDTSGELIAINEGTARETQSAIEALIGPLDLFLWTSFAGQNDIEALIHLSPSEMKDVLVQVLQMNFDGRLAIAKQNHIGATKGAEAAEMMVESIRRTTPDISVTDDNLEQLRIRRDALEEDGKEVQDIDLLEEALEDQRRSITILEAEVSGLDDWKTASRDDSAKAMILDGKITKAHTAASQAQGLKSKLRAVDITGMRFEEKTIRDLMGTKRDEVQKKIDPLESELSDVAMQVSNLRATITILDDKYNRAVEALDRSRSIASMLDDVPCGGKIWAEDEAKPLVDMGKCQFLQDAKAQAESLPAMEEMVKTTLANVSAAGAELNSKKKDFEALEHRIQSMKSEARIEEKALGDKLDILEAEIGLALAQEQTNSDLRAKLSALSALEESLPELLEEREVLAGRMATQIVRISEIEAKRDLLIKENTRKNSLILAISKTKEAKEVWSRLMSSLNEAMAVARSEHDRAIAGAEELDRVEGILAGHRKEELIASKYCQALHRDGIPFLLLEQFAIPGLKELANEYLVHTGMTIDIQSEKELTSGDLRNEVYITFTDYRGSFSLSSASGFQATAIGMALMNSLADVRSRASGSRVWLSVQDEGFGTMDIKNLDLAKNTIRAIAEKKGCYLFVSHLVGMADCADSTIHITDHDGVSRLEVSS